MCSLDCQIIQKYRLKCARGKHIALWDCSAFSLIVNHIQAHSCHTEISGKHLNSIEMESIFSTKHFEQQLEALTLSTQKSFEAL